MTTKKQKLELTWIGKEARPKLEPRILLEDPARSYHAMHRVAEGDLFDNRLIFGYKAKAAVEWCAHASDYSARHGGKPWRYLLIPHDAVAVNATLVALATRFAL